MSIKLLSKIKNRIRIIYLKWKYPNIVIGKGVKIDFNSKINIFQNRLIIEEDVKINSRQNGYHAGMPFYSRIFIDVQNAFVHIGSNTRLNGVFIHAQKSIRIGKNCVIAAGVNIIDSNGHEVKSLNRTVGRDIPKEIIIGDNVWIGLNSIVLKGSNIGTNSVIAAGSVVKGQFPNNSIISGNPAKLTDKIKFDNEASHTQI